MGTTNSVTEFEIYDSESQKSPLLEELVYLIRYRDLVREIISRNIKVRYKRSMLGVLWTMISPLLMMTVLTVVFSSIFRFSVDNYAIYVLSGLVIWNFFSESTSEAMSEMVYSGSLFSRIRVPKAIFAVAAVGNGLINLAVSLVPLLLIMVILGVRIKPSALLIPIPIAIEVLITLGVGLVLSNVALYFADVLVIYRVLLLVMFYLTPIIYPIELLPEYLRRIMALNPLFYVIQIFRSLLYVGNPLEVGDLLLAAGMALVILFFGWWVFARKADEYPYRV